MAENQHRAQGRLFASADGIEVGPPNLASQYSGQVSSSRLKPSSAMAFSNFGSSFAHSAASRLRSIRASFSATASWIARLRLGKTLLETIPSTRLSVSLSRVIATFTLLMWCLRSMTIYHTSGPAVETATHGIPSGPHSRRKAYAQSPGKQARAGRASGNRGLFRSIPDFLLQCNELGALEDLFASGKINELHHAVRWRGDRVLHLHRFENEQRLTFLHARAGFDHHLDHFPGHRRGERPARPGVLRRLQLLPQGEPPVVAVVEHVPVAAVAHRARLEAPSIQTDEQPVSFEAVIPRTDQQPLAIIGKTHPHRMARLAIHENEIVVGLLVEPPAIDAVPGRVRIARGCGLLARRLLLRRQLGKGGRRQHFVRHGRARREQLRAVPSDQPGIELGGRKGVARRPPSEV